GGGRVYFGYGGDFGEELHDGNFVCDGLLFPDRTPSPGLAEYKKVIEPVRIAQGSTPGTVRLANLYDLTDLSHLELVWSYDTEAGTVASGPLAAPPLGPGESTELKLPEPPEEPQAGEAVWTIRATLAADTPWAERGHEVAWGQIAPRGGAEPRPAPAAPLPPLRDGTPGSSTLGNGAPGSGTVTLGPGTFDAATGTLLTVAGAVTLTHPPALDIWRAPTDNDEGAPWQPDTRYGPLWRELGLHRMRHRTDGVELTDGAVTVRTRVAPAATDLGLRTVYRWTVEDGALRLEVSVEPEGEWPCPLPRLGLRFGLPAGYGQAGWFGGGPGEAYPDTRAAARIGLWHAAVDELQTPYVRPQENGARCDVRWAELHEPAPDGRGRTLRVTAVGPPFWFSARRWTSEQLDAARHTPDLVPGDVVWVNVDHALHGIGSQSCGPGVLPEHRLDPAPARFALRFGARAG
ncbi:beta-galactosidase small subunit family protein, partial [Streptomyces boncukensis]